MSSLEISESGHTDKTNAKKIGIQRQKPDVENGNRQVRNKCENDSCDYPFIHKKLECEEIKRSVRRLSSEVLHRVGDEEIRNVKSHTELAETANGVRMLARNLAKATIQLDVKAIMIVTKARDNSLIYLTREVVEFLVSLKKGILVYVDKNLEKLKRFNVAELMQTNTEAQKHLKFWDKDTTWKMPELFDLVVTLGGDGTVLYVSNLFQRIVPPVISFALGSLGFLTNFDYQNFREKMTLVLESGVRAYLRMRFTCRVHRADGTLVCEQQVLNELSVDRGPSPYVTQLELYGDGSLITVAQADGLIIATPTGSTAYSLSAGGSLVHPGVSAISVTPICPHTLSFRPILLPDGMLLKVRVPAASRSTVWASFDGKVRTELGRGDYVTIQASLFPFPTVICSKMEFFDSASRNLNWNSREQQKPFSRYLSDQHKELLKEGSSEAVHDTDDEYDINFNEDSDSALSHNESCSRFVPPPGAENATPPENRYSFTSYDELTCFAHPHARVSINNTARFNLS